MILEKGAVLITVPVMPEAVVTPVSATRLQESRAAALPGVHETKLGRSAYSGQVAAMLREAIIAGELRGGTPLVEMHLAEQLTVSRGPVRSALQALESEGLVKTMANGRTIVVGFDERDMRDLFSVRYTLESTAIKLGVKRKRSVDAVVAAFDAFEAEGASTPHLVDLDLAFHRALVEFSGSRYLVQCWLAMVPVLHTVITIGNRRLAARERESNFERIVDYHRPLVEAIIARHPAEAVVLLREQFRVAVSLHGPARERPIE